jgi:hypothetical protein
MNITLNEAERLVLYKTTWNRGGGFQNFMHRLQALCNRQTGEMALTFDDREHIVRYAFDYGQGGWENKLKDIFRRTLGEDLGLSELPKSDQPSLL